MGCLYQLTFPSGKSYIGITKHSASHRFGGHVKQATNGKKRIGAVQRAINKYGAANIIIETLVRAEWTYLTELEPKAIAAFGTKYPGGYNLTDGGEGNFGLVVSEETREKLRIINIGKKASVETKKKMRETAANKVWTEELRNKYRVALGKKHSAESILKMRKAHSGKKLSATHIASMQLARLGFKHTNETRKKISEAHRGRIMTAEHRANLSKSAAGRKMSPESIAKQWTTRRAKAPK